MYNPNGSQPCKYDSIPSEWKCVPLKEVATKITNGLTYDTNLTIGSPVTRIETISDGTVNLDKTGSISEKEAKEEYLLRQGDILYSHINSVSQIGKTAIFDDNSSLYHGMNLLLIRANENINSSYLYYFLNSSVAIKQAYCCAKRAVNQASLSTSDLKKFEVFLPPKIEQLKIAEILSTWDKTISTTQSLIDELKHRNNGLAHQLLTGKKRLKGFDEKWNAYKISDLFQLVNRHIQWDENHFYNLVSIRRRHGGLFFRGTFEAREIKVKKLKRIETNDFLISKRQVSHGAWAIVPNRYNSHLVSDEYDCLAIKNKENLDSNFWTFYCQQPILTHYAFLDSIGVHIEKLIFHYRQFKKRVVKIPELKEQLAITSVLTEAGKELQLYQQQLTYLKEQKKGLMQKLLTGEVRVNTNIQE